MTQAELSLLRILASTQGYVACDGTNRAVAQQLEQKGLAAWRGENWGSSFWCITPKGIHMLRLYKDFGNG